jgi:hypothetical protein
MALGRGIFLDLICTPWFSTTSRYLLHAKIRRTRNNSKHLFTAERCVFVGIVPAVVICIAEISDVDAFSTIRTTFLTRGTADGRR